MVKVLSSTLQQCLGPFTMLLVEGTSETGFLRHLSNHLLRSPYFRKYIGFATFGYARKNWEKVFCFWDICILTCCNKLSLFKKKMLFLGSQCVKKQSYYFVYNQERPFETKSHSQWPINMVKLLPFRFQQCFGTFTVWVFKGSSEMGLFRHLCNHVLCSP